MHGELRFSDKEGRQQAMGVAALRKGRKCVMIEKNHEVAERIKERFMMEELRGKKKVENTVTVAV